MRDSNAKKFEMLYSFHADRVVSRTDQNTSRGGDFARGPRIISLVFVKFMFILIGVFVYMVVFSSLRS